MRTYDRVLLGGQGGALARSCRLVFRPWAEGTDNVPREGPAILASNHLSFSDHFFAPLPLPRKVVFLAKSEYFTGRGIKGLVSKAFFSGVGQIPVDRSGGEASERALRTGLRVLAQGDLLGIYPEGTRTPDGRLYRGKTGVARLALEARAPVIPCAMIGGFEFQPPGKITPRLRFRPGRPVRQAAGLLPLLRHGERPARAPRGHRRDHVRAHEAVRPGVRRRVRPAPRPPCPRSAWATTPPTATPQPEDGDPRGPTRSRAPQRRVRDARRRQTVPARHRVAPPLHPHPQHPTTPRPPRPQRPGGPLG